MIHFTLSLYFISVELLCWLDGKFSTLIRILNYIKKKFGYKANLTTQKKKETEQIKEAKLLRMEINSQYIIP